MKRMTLAQHLVAHGLCPNHQAATALALAGQVLVNNRPAKAGLLLKATDQVRLRGQALPFASSGGFKLQAALGAFAIQPSERICLDAGASTGGFTDCLLQAGAALVYAVDVGFGQLTGKLRQDRRVVNLEQTNLSDPRLHTLDPRPSLGTCDLSYLSLRDALPAYQKIMHHSGEVIALVKPLFEVEDMQARRNGIIPDEQYAPMLRGLIAHLNAIPGMSVLKLCHSPVLGGNGTIEFFLHLRFSTDRIQPDLEEDILNSIRQALNLQAAESKGALS